MKLDIKIPTVLAFDDYHEIRYLKDYLKEIIPGIKVKEVGGDYYYYGLVYLGKLPSKEVVDSLVKEAGYSKEVNEQRCNSKPDKRLLWKFVP